MSDQIETQQPKTPRKGSRSNRDTAGLEPTIPGQQRQSVPNRGQPRGGSGNGRGRGRGNQHANRQQSEWNGVTAQDSQGDFDENGTFVLAGTISQQGHHNGKKRSNKKPPNNTNYIQEAAVTMPEQQLPFPTLRGTPHKHYAGPTFHASPAASALPMPRFFSKSVPNPATVAPSLQERVDHESAQPKRLDLQATPEQSPVISRVQLAETQPRNESPLDFMFSADRAEKAKRHTPTLAASSIVNSPRGEASKPAEKTPSHWASIYGARPHHQRNFSADSSKGLFMMELDGGSQSSLPQSETQNLIARPSSNTPPTSMHRAVSDHVGQSPFNRQSPVHSAARHGISNGEIPSEMEGTSAANVGTLPVNHQSRPSSVPHNSGSAPFQTPPPSKLHSHPLHYGNKNLSPMFQAARNSSPRNQSQLRREVRTEIQGPPVNELPGSLPQQRNFNHANDQTLATDAANAAAQKYLSDMLNRASTNVNAHTSGVSSAPPRTYPHGTPSHASIKESAASPPTQQSPGGVSVHQTMENNLRKLLKISEN